MKKIIVAGAGHGGLVAAINLARQGYDITVYESKKREEMGYDWHDYLNLTAFDMSGIERPSEDKYTMGLTQGFKNPSATMKIDVEVDPDSMTMDRKELINHLLTIAETAGVKILYSQTIVSPMVIGSTVTGLLISDGERQYTVTADLIIDAAGMYSPVRSKLPKSLGIDNEIEEKNIFHVYRAYFNNTDGSVSTPPYTINLFHMNRPGQDWTITEKEYVDILIGKFGMSGKLTEQEVDEAIASFREDFPYIGDKIVRGGVFADIPLMKMMPLIVANGYAAVGDSAGMTVPLNGSGIVLSMRAGKILADTIIEADGEYTIEKLWRFEYEYFQTLGKDLIFVDILKNFFTYINGGHVDLFMEKGVLSAETLSFGDGSSFKVTPDLVRSVAGVAPHVVPLFAPLIGRFKSLPVSMVLEKTMPKQYDKQKVENWIKAYKAL